MDLNGISICKGWLRSIFQACLNRLLFYYKINNKISFEDSRTHLASWKEYNGGESVNMCKMFVSRSLYEICFWNIPMQMVKYSVIN